MPRFDLDKANALMQEADYGDGFSITMMAPNNRYIEDQRIAQAVAAMLAKSNIKVGLQSTPKAQYWERFDERIAAIMMIGWQSDTQDSAKFYEFLVMTPDSKTGYGQYTASRQLFKSGGGPADGRDSDHDRLKAAGRGIEEDRAHSLR